MLKSVNQSVLDLYFFALLMHSCLGHAVAVKEVFWPLIIITLSFLDSIVTRQSAFDLDYIGFSIQHWFLLYFGLH